MAVISRPASRTSRACSATASGWSRSTMTSSTTCRRRPSIVVVISDFYEDVDNGASALAHLRGRGNDLMVFHVLDPREIDFSFSDASNFIDMETGEKMPVIPEYLRK